MKSLLKTLTLCGLLCYTCLSKSFGQSYDVGVFYMPFWEYGTPGDISSSHWALINNYDSYLVGKGLANKARIPQNVYWPSPVWYDESMQSVNEIHMEQMSTHGINFAIYDSFYMYYGGGSYGPYYAHAMENLIKPGFNNHGVQFSLMWANDFLGLVDGGKCEAFFRGGGLSYMVQYWSQYLRHPNYKKINGKPVFYIFYPTTIGNPHTNTIEGMCGMCAGDSFFSSMGADANEPYINSKKTKFLLEKIEQLLGEEIYFVAVLNTEVEPITGYNDDHNNHNYNKKWDWLKKHPEDAGYDAITSYGYKYFDSEDAYLPYGQTSYSCNGNPGPLNWAYNYIKMQSVSIRFYDYIITNSTLDYQVPVSAGWNQAPLTMDEVSRGITTNNQNAADCNLYKKDPLDGAESTPATFYQSLLNAKSVADNYPTRTKKTIAICCWNEFAEGTYIQPTYNWGTQYLDQVLNAFVQPSALASANPMGLTEPNLTLEDYKTYVYPNPSSTVSNISFFIKNATRIDIRALDLKGQQLEQLMKQKIEPGRHTVSWNVSSLKRGIYVVDIKINGKSDVKKIMVN